MKTQVEQLIDRLAKEITPKQYAFRHAVLQWTALEDWMNECPNDQFFEEACAIHADGHPIRIGDVLEAMRTMNREGFQGHEGELRLIVIWGQIGFKKSLQEIFATADFITIPIYSYEDGVKTFTRMQEVANGQLEQWLFSLLLSFRI